jgi:hypothetical protein
LRIRGVTRVLIFLNAAGREIQRGKTLAIIPPQARMYQIVSGRGTDPVSTDRKCQEQANYINALAVSVSPFFEPAKGTLGGYFFLCGWIFL